MTAQHNPDETMEESNLKVKQHLVHVVCFHASLMMIVVMLMIMIGIINTVHSFYSTPL